MRGQKGIKWILIIKQNLVLNRIIYVKVVRSSYTTLNSHKFKQFLLQG